VRDKAADIRTAIPSNRWASGRCPTGQASLVPSSTDICYFDGFKADRLYELIYMARDPVVMGLGHATTRDVASFLRYEARDDAGNPNPLATGSEKPAVRRLYATGASQTGGYLRNFVYLGFNENEAHRKVFDGIIPTIAGTNRVFINVRFADPNLIFGPGRSARLSAVELSPVHLRAGRRRNPRGVAKRLGRCAELGPRACHRPVADGRFAGPRSRVFATRKLKPRQVRPPRGGVTSSRSAPHRDRRDPRS
jgi:hypothetical protein